MLRDSALPTDKAYAEVIFKRNPGEGVFEQFGVGCDARPVLSSRDQIRSHPTADPCLLAVEKAEVPGGVDH
jgi:hypothetical protein